MFTRTKHLISLSLVLMAMGYYIQARAGTSAVAPSVPFHPSLDDHTSELFSCWESISDLCESESGILAPRGLPPFVGTPDEPLRAAIHEKLERIAIFPGKPTGYWVLTPYTMSWVKTRVGCAGRRVGWFELTDLHLPTPENPIIKVETLEGQVKLRIFLNATEAAEPIKESELGCKRSGRGLDPRNLKRVSWTLTDLDNFAIRNSIGNQIVRCATSIVKNRAQNTLKIEDTKKFYLKLYSHIEPFKPDGRCSEDVRACVKNYETECEERLRTKYTDLGAQKLALDSNQTPGEESELLDLTSLVPNDLKLKSYCNSMSQTEELRSAFLHNALASSDCRMLQRTEVRQALDSAEKAVPLPDSSLPSPSHNE